MLLLSCEIYADVVLRVLIMVRRELWQQHPSDLLSSAGMSRKRSSRGAHDCLMLGVVALHILPPGATIAVSQKKPHRIRLWIVAKCDCFQFKSTKLITWGLVINICITVWGNSGYISVLISITIDHKSAFSSYFLFNSYSLPSTHLNQCWFIIDLTLHFNEVSFKIEIPWLK